ncbi:MAG: hypothetical protein K8I29_13375 [Alphaproteobacteria bacterium]|uniref:Uncharacterized protein n=1 Tax=Candidatus Nitrobium versatile TaxID=2884831 RepID=A0A953M2A4_9BACT|nr:hypothetical protein [Candidatus Nitrobium versatile]
MKAEITMDFNVASTGEAQEMLKGLCEKLRADGVISAYHFAIQAETGTVTEKCILEEGKVIA